MLLPSHHLNLLYLAFHCLLCWNHLNILCFMRPDILTLSYLILFNHRHSFRYLILTAFNLPYTRTTLELQCFSNIQTGIISKQWFITYVRVILHLLEQSMKLFVLFCFMNYRFIYFCVNALFLLLFYVQMNNFRL